MRSEAQNAWRDWDDEELERELKSWPALQKSRQTMNLKNADWKHIVLIAITVIVGVYDILVKDGVPLPVQVGTVVLMLTSIANWLNGSPVATAAQIAAKSTLSDIRRMAKGISK
jgi:hypothetical protein